MPASKLVLTNFKYLQMLANGGVPEFEDAYEQILQFDKVVKALGVVVTGTSLKELLEGKADDLTKGLITPTIAETACFVDPRAE